MRTHFMVTIVLAMAPGSASGQTTAPAEDAAPLYLRAAAIVRADDAKKIVSPAASSLVYSDYPPMSAEWLRMEKPDYEAHAQVRALVHQASAIEQATWPKWDPKDIRWCVELRNLANEIGDAALYQGIVLKDEPAAFQTLGDLMHMNDLLRNQPDESLIRLLVATGMDALALDRLSVIQANAAITEDPRDAHDLQVSTAKDWIARLLNHPDAQAEIDQVIKSQHAANAAATQPITNSRPDCTIRRVLAERDLVAMALAAHIYEHQHGHWPANLEELSADLPRVPIDPWGNGKQTLAYVLIKAGLPDGSDRPLVYSRDWSRDGLFFRIDQPQYSWYSHDGSNVPVNQQKHGGQCRDVAGWAPPAQKKPGPTTAPLP